MTAATQTAVSTTPPLGRDFLQALVSGPDLEQACLAEREGRDPLELLVGQQVVRPRDILVALARRYNCPFVWLRRFAADEGVVSMISHDLARRFLVLPVFRTSEHLYVAMADPTDLPALDFLRRLSGLSVLPVVAMRVDLEDAMRRDELGADRAKKAMGDITAEQPEPEPVSPLEVTLEDNDAPVVRLVGYILSHAIQLGASDVHLEPFASEIAMRFRVDGILHEFPPPPLHMFRPLVSRIKILAGLDISERRLPQDGRLTFQIGEKSYDLRVSVMPGVHGENLVVRILDAVGAHHHLEDLGFSGGMLELWERMISQPYGMILVTGPTGSGKTTTLYTTLRHIYTPRRKYLTLEDPVECHLAGINQFQVQPSIGFSFAQGLKSALRHDPDVIMVGEIRDLESAEIALRSSLTGHLLFSTLHTNNAPLAVTRLVDMGVPPFLVMSSLIGVLAQRLVRRLCPDCREPVRPTPQEWMSIGVHAPPEGTVYRSRGCTACGHLGYRGRVGVYELLEITPRMRSAAQDGHLLERLREESHFITLHQSAVEKFQAGLTSLEEVVGLRTTDD